MTLIKSLLLTSAASIAAVTGAHAADLPSRKSAPVEYVRICDAYGAGFFYIPGTDTCIKVGGLVYGEERALSQTYQMGSNSSSTFYGNGVSRATAAGTYIPSPNQYTNARDRDIQGSSALGRIELDARTQTGWGTVRTFLRVDAFYGSGANAATGGNQAISNTFNTTAGAGAARETTIVNKAFIQFAGLTAGRAQSVFDFYADAYNYANLRGSNATVELLSYTYSFGNGFSGTISIEDNDSRRAAIGSTIASTGGTVAFGGGGGGGTAFAAPGAYASYVALPQGNRLPEIVGNLRYDAAWGAVQLSGAAHQIEGSLYGSTATATIANSTTSGAAAPLAYTNSALTTEKMGFAVQLGLQYNMDMISPGDKFWVEAAWENGAYSYIAGNNLASSYGPVSQNRYAGDAFTPVDNSAGWNPNPGYDCVFTGSGSCEKTWGFDVTAAYKHYWIPTLASAVYGSYTETHNSTNAVAGFSGAGTGVLGAVGTPNLIEARIGTNLVWTPIKGFDIGTEVMYIHLNETRPVGLASDTLLSAAGLPTWKSNQDQVEGRVRVQRAF